MRLVKHLTGELPREAGSTVNITRAIFQDRIAHSVSVPSTRVKIPGQEENLFIDQQAGQSGAAQAATSYTRGISRKMC